jgi:two-component system sensor histidine kinase HydH
MILMGAILLLLAFLGMALLLLLVRYRSTKESLVEVQAFSDNLRQEIARNQRLVTVGRLAAGIAHEIRNPLSSIKGFATYFSQRYKENPEDARISGIMIQEVERLNTVVTQLLEFARPVNIQKKVTSVKALVADSLKMIENRALEKNITIETRVDEDLKITMDPNRMNQVLLNLYLNAMEAMETGGTLGIEARASKTENGFHIRVSDTGCGIRSEDLPHLFDLYYTTKPHGNGIGLAIVSNIMEAHNGKVTVESKEDRGSTFDIFLPGEKGSGT